MIAAQQIAELLGGVDALGNPVHDMMELDELVAKGIPRSAFDALIDRLAAGAEEKGIRRMVVDRGGFRFHGRLRALVEAAGGSKEGVHGEIAKDARGLRKLRDTTATLKKGGEGEPHTLVGTERRSGATQ